MIPGYDAWRTSAPDDRSECEWCGVMHELFEREGRWLCDGCYGNVPREWWGEGGEYGTL